MHATLSDANEPTQERMAPKGYVFVNACLFIWGVVGLAVIAAITLQLLNLA